MALASSGRETRSCRSKTIIRSSGKSGENYGIAAEKGVGVFNGDMGIVREINTFAEILTVGV